MVDHINGMKTTWKAEVYERFAKMPESDLKRMMGVIPDERIKAHLNKIQYGQIKEEVDMIVGDDELPKEFDAREQWKECAEVVGNIRDQSACGSCWAVAGAGAIADRICIKSKGEVKPTVSAIDVTSCAKSGDGCRGTTNLLDAWNYFSKKGIVTGSDYDAQEGCKPYPFEPHSKKRSLYRAPACEAKCQANYTTNSYSDDKHYGVNPKSLRLYGKDVVKNIQKELYTNGPVEIAFYVYRDFIQYKSGIYKHKSGEFLGGHAVRVIGWGEEEDDDGNVIPFWRIANSWNTGWGEEGTFRILRGKNECMIEGWAVTFGDADLEHK
jgi:cathepsin B